MELELIPKDESGQKPEAAVPQEDPLKYTGPDRRRTPRRIKVDRREMVRFENTPDRRHSADRRLNTHMWDGRAF